MGKQGTISKILANLMLIMAVVAIIGFLALYTDGFTEDFTTFYAEYNGKKILSKTDGLEMTVSEPFEINIRYTFASKNENTKDYFIKIVPNIVERKDFDFYADEKAYSYQAEKDLTLGFEIIKNESYFTIRPKGNITEILQAVYPQKKVSDCRSMAYKDMFSLIITSYNGEANVIILFSIIEKVSGIIIDREVIIF